MKSKNTNNNKKKIVPQGWRPTAGPEWLPVPGARSGVQEAPQTLGLSLHPGLAPQLSGLLFLTQAKAQEPGASSALQLGLGWGGGGKLCSKDRGSHAPGPS